MKKNSCILFVLLVTSVFVSAIPQTRWINGFEYPRCYAVIQEIDELLQELAYDCADFAYEFDGEYRVCLGSIQNSLTILSQDWKPFIREYGRYCYVSERDLVLICQAIYSLHLLIVNCELPIFANCYRSLYGCADGLDRMVEAMDETIDGWSPMMLVDFINALTDSVQALGWLY